LENKPRETTRRETLGIDSAIEEERRRHEGSAFDSSPLRDEPTTPPTTAATIKVRGGNKN
jgi:hypothetical protein